MKPLPDSLAGFTDDQCRRLSAKGHASAHAELVRRGLRSSDEQHTEARKGAARAGTGTRLAEWRDA